MENMGKIEMVLLLFLCSFIPACDDEAPPGSANHRFYQSMEWNDMHQFQEIIIPADDYSILSIADIHAGGTVNLDLFIGKAKKTDPAAVVIVGDLTLMGAAEDFAEFERHIPVKDTLNCLFVAGNHDLYKDGWPEFFERFGSSTYYFTVKTPVAADLFICIETGGFSLGNKQLDWLKGILENNRPAFRRCFVLTHVNFFRTRRTTSTNPFPEEVKALLALFYKNNVDMVVAGHDHKHSFEQFGNTTYLIMDALEDDFQDAGYLKLKITNGKVSYSFEKL
jgi:predicted phosphodiesterase